MNNIVVIDNYDSFTYNLVQYVERITGGEVDVYRNDKVAISELEKYDKIILSPGPGIPVEAGISLELVKRYAPTKRILGVCLGHQTIAEAFGGNLVNYNRVYHGVAAKTNILDQLDYLFKGLPKVFDTGRYHAWGVTKDGLPGCFSITAEDEEGNIMAISHKQYDVKGVQFHPESVLTEYGMEIMKNWMNGGLL